MSSAAPFTSSLSSVTFSVPRNLLSISPYSSPTSISFPARSIKRTSTTTTTTTTKSPACPPLFLCSASATKSSAPPEEKGKVKRASGITKPRPVSPEMQTFVGAPEISRTEALKLIWAHIKDNSLQDPENKKIILCDEKLKSIFGDRKSVGFLEIASLITPHFLK